MKLGRSTAEIFVPDGVSDDVALERTTHMGIAAHPDDLEILSYHGILQSFHSRQNWFLGVVATDGSGSPREALYRDYTDEQMRAVRCQEQKKAATVGEYSAVAMLDYPSAAVKDPNHKEVVEDIRRLIEAGRPSVLYTHNPADKHDTHVAVLLRTIEAVRQVPQDAKPKAIFGCEVWRDLDWVVDGEKVAFDVAAHENLAASLLGVFDSQVSGGKRYDLATLGRWRANATYYETHGTDVTTAMIYAIDITPLVEEPTLGVIEFIRGYIDRFADDVSERLRRLG